MMIINKNFFCSIFMKMCKMKYIAVIYTEVECFWGRVVRLKDCQLYNDEFTNWEIKHWRCFWRFLLTFICKQQFGNNSTEAQSGRFSKYVFLLQGVVAGNSWLKCGRVKNRPSLYLKPLNNYQLVNMSRSLYNGANKAYFRAYLVQNIVASSACIRMKFVSP